MTGNDTPYVSRFWGGRRSTNCDQLTVTGTHARRRQAVCDLTIMDFAIVRSPTWAILLRSAARVIFAADHARPQRTDAAHAISTAQ